MERLTVRKHDYVLLKKDGQTRTPMELSGQEIRMVMERLAEYEDEAEQREKGCGWCTKWAKKPENWECTVLKDNGKTVTTPSGYIMSTEAEYCPVCGRKLV